MEQSNVFSLQWVFYYLVQDNCSFLVQRVNTMWKVVSLKEFLGFTSRRCHFLWRNWQAHTCMMTGEAREWRMKIKSEWRSRESCKTGDGRGIQSWAGATIASVYRNNHSEFWFMRLMVNEEFVSYIKSHSSNKKGLIAVLLTPNTVMTAKVSTSICVWYALASASVMVRWKHFHSGRGPEVNFFLWVKEGLKSGSTPCEAVRKNTQPSYTSPPPGYCALWSPCREQQQEQWGWKKQKVQLKRECKTRREQELSANTTGKEKERQS